MVAASTAVLLLNRWRERERERESSRITQPERRWFEGRSKQGALMEILKGIRGIDCSQERGPSCKLERLDSRPKDFRFRSSIFRPILFAWSRRFRVDTKNLLRQTRRPKFRSPRFAIHFRPTSFLRTNIQGNLLGETWIKNIVSLKYCFFAKRQFRQFLNKSLDNFPRFHPFNADDCRNKKHVFLETTFNKFHQN